MSDENAKVLEELSAQSKSVSSAPHVVTLPPRSGTKMTGRPGTTYQLTVINLDQQLDAVVYAYNRPDWFINNLTLAHGETRREVFQMNSDGEIFVYNWTDNEFYPNPEVTFVLRALT